MLKRYVSIPILHNSVKLLSLEQRRQIHVLKLIYLQAQKGRTHAVTRSQTKYVFKTETKNRKKNLKITILFGYPFMEPFR